MVNVTSNSRVDWVDYAKGICIILVVMMHSTLGVEKAAGDLTWMHPFIDWARPFRMPDFFLISGLFLSSRIDRPWRSYLDSKFVHFMYFYILWMSIQVLSKAYGIYAQQGSLAVLSEYILGFVQPFGTLWFIYVLAIFFPITKLLRNTPPLLVFVVAAMLEMASIETGWTLIDEFASRYVYFYVGYWFAKNIFEFARQMTSQSMPYLLAILTIWGVGNYEMVQLGYATLPGIGLALGFIGAGAVITAGVVLSKTGLAAAIRYCGENSIVIYLSFFLFMAGSRFALLKFAPALDLGQIALLVTAIGVIGPMLLFWVTRNTNLSFLFRRPAWAKLAIKNQRWHNVNYVNTKLHIKTR